MTDQQLRSPPLQPRARGTVEAVLDALDSALAERGWAGASTRHLASVAGLNVGAIYRYFPNKGAIGILLARRYLGRVVDQVERHLGEDCTLPPREALHGYVADMLRSVRQKQAFHAAFVPMFLDLANDPRMIAVEREAMDRVVALVEAWLQRHPHPARHTDPATLAFLAVASLEGTIKMSLLKRPELILMPELERGILDTLEALLFPT